MRPLVLPLTVAALLLTGCAGSPPKPTFVQAPKKDALVDVNDQATVVVKPASGVEMINTDIQRLSEVISQKVNEKKAKNGAGGEVSAYEIEVSVTRYEKGNAFARAMLAGLGQIHLDANVRLLSAESHSQLGQFEIKKTFAWGGVYGAATGMDDIEPAFAEGIAAALTGTPEDSKQQSAQK